MKDTVIGMDIAKNVFQLHVVDPDTGEMQRIKLKRAQVAEYFANRPAAVVAMEACGGAHYWAGVVQRLGHTVKLLAPAAVRPFVPRNKNDAADARAIWTAVQQPGARLVAIKSPTQQAVLALHRMRAQLMKFRHMQSNALRGLLLEFGLALPEGYGALCKAMPATLAQCTQQLPAVLVDTLREQWARVGQIDHEMALIERRLAQMERATPACQSIRAIPGIGPLTASAAIATIGDAHYFRNGRELAAWLGLVPRQVGTGGRIELRGISKRGDTYLRTLLMQGARSVLSRTKNPSAWLTGLLARRPYNVVVAALANKMARTLWAVLVKGKPFDPKAFSALG